MDFNEYQEVTRKTATYPTVGGRIVVPTLGLVGEAGEVAEKVKKIFRDDEGIISEEKKEEIKKELGDVLWYLTQIASDLDLTLEEVAEKNIEKTQSRYKRGVSQGSGDNR